MRISRYFTRGVMNMDSDERSVPNGMYRWAENIRVTNSDGSNAGLVKNLKGMIKRVELSEVFTMNPFTNAVTIGVGKDDFSECIYWLVKTDGDDYLLEWNKQINQVARVLQGDLGLSENHSVLEIHVIRDSYSGKIFLSWTDGNMPPRLINLQRAKTYSIGGFEEDDLSLIKKPPRKEPKIELLSSLESGENYMKEKIVGIAYRYKYLDGEYSPLSSFSIYAFNPKPFDLDFATKENVGMVNRFNSLRILFNTGNKRVTDIDLVYKEAGANTLYKIQTFNKESEEWGNNEEKEFIFKNDKVYSVLPEKQLYRLYDSVPLKATDMTIIDGRIVFSDITEGRNMIDNEGDKVNMDYELSLVGEQMVESELPSENDIYFKMSFDGVSLSAGVRLIFHIFVRETQYGASYQGVFDYILPNDINSALDLLNDSSFVSFVEDVWSQEFFQEANIDLPEHSEFTEQIGFKIMTSLGTPNNQLYIRAPLLWFRTDNTSNNPSDNDYTEDTFVMEFTNPSRVLISNHANSSSLKSNRSIEAGVLYLDPESRQSPVLVSKENTVFIPIDRSTYKNQIQVELKNNPPEWADRYRFVVKQNRWGHETIYISTFYFDGAYVWCLLDGANKDKVKEGDTLIVKSDVSGVAEILIKTRVLEIKEQPRGFLNDAEDDDNNIINGEAGIYMKIRPNGFDMGESNVNQLVFVGDGRYKDNHPIGIQPEFGYYDDANTFIPYELTEGSRVRIYIHLWRHGSRSFDIVYDNTYMVGANYTSYKKWFEAEADLSSFEYDVVNESQVSADGYIDSYEYGTGYGFTENGERFWVRHLGGGSGARKLYTNVKWEIYTAEINNIIFETEPKELDVDIYYETGETFEIKDGKHQGNIQNQTDSQNAIVLLNTFNCFVQGNGAESYKIKDNLNGNALTLDTRPTTTLDDEYKERNLFSSYTWGGNYEEFTQYNSLNEFNRSLLNIKQLDDAFGAIRRVLSTGANIILFQEDKISQSLYRKKALFNQDGSSNIGATDVDFGDQIPYLHNNGVSHHPESIAVHKNNAYFTDSKRGVVCRLSVNGIDEIPGYYYDTGNIRREMMGDWFRDVFRNNRNLKCVGAYDVEHNEYVLHIQSKLTALEKTSTSSFSKTLGFNEDGWTSAYTFSPERMISMNGKLYAFKDGDLWECNADPNNCNSFFGVQYPSKIKSLLNDFPSEVKVHNALNIEGNVPWDISFKTNLVNGTIKKEEFRNIEAEWYAHFRKNETIETHSLATQGIGEIDEVGNGYVKFSFMNPVVCVGDKIYVDDLNGLFGVITNIDGNTINYSPAGYLVPQVGMYVFSQKSMRAEGSNIRGYYLEFEMMATPEQRVELYSVNTEISKSNP